MSTDLDTVIEKKHILVVSQYFYPETFRINDICTDLIDRGFQVTVLTGYPNYPDGKFYDGYKANKIRKENYNGINIIRLPIIARGDKKLTLALNYASFVISGLFWKAINNIDADYVFIYEVSPMTQALPGVWYAKKNKIPCYLYVMDLWPENVQIAGNINNKLIINTIGNMVDYIYENTTKIFTSSKSFIGKINDRGVPKEKIEFWPQYAEEHYYPLKKSEVPKNEIPDDGILNLTFAGNIGYAQGLDLLPKVASLFQKNNIKIRFNIIGDGRFKEEFVLLIKKLNIQSYFNLINSQPAQKIKEYMAYSDASLITLSEDKLFELTIPAKVQSSLACGVPIIGSISGETKDLIESSNVGFCSDAGDVEGLYENILKLQNTSKKERNKLKENARNYYLQNFEKEMLMNTLEKQFTV